MGTTDHRVAVIIEDDPDIRRLLVEVLEQAGFETHSAGNGLEGVEKVRTYSPGLTTLDVSMPGIDGFEAAKRIRAISDTFLIMLTARGDEIDTLMGLESGADDYMVKPFRPRELRARVDAMRRRLERERVAAEQRADASQTAPIVGVAPDLAAPAMSPVVTPADGHVPSETSVTAPPPSAPAPYAPTVTPAVAGTTEPAATTVAPAPAEDPAGAVEEDGWLEHRGLRLHPEMHLVTLDGEGLELTRSEFELMYLLLTTRRRVRSKADLALALRGESYVTSYYVSEADKRAVEVHLANLRRKLGESATNPRLIETVRGVGYRLTADE